jgi:hypothetical protein
MPIDRGIRGAVGAGVCLVVLSGCVPVAQIYLGLEQGSLVALVCESVSADTIEASYFDQDTPQGTVIWQSKGEVDLRAGTEIVLGRSPAGMVEEMPLRAIPESADGISIAIQTTDEDGSPDGWLYADFDHRAVSSTQWLADDGSTHDRPC